MAIEDFKRSYQLAPILLVNGIAANFTSNGHISILTLTEGSDSVNYPDDNQYFAHFRPQAGGTLQDWGIAEYPFASMNMAANAVIQQPLKISLLMLCPSRDGNNSYPSIQAKLTYIKQQLDQHILSGGTFTVATPGYIYENCLLTSLRDVSSAGDKKVQAAFQWDFAQPLITQQAATQSFNNLYSKLAGNLPVPNPPTNSGINNTIGNAPTNQPTDAGRPRGGA